MAKETGGKLSKFPLGAVLHGKVCAVKLVIISGAAGKEKSGLTSEIIALQSERFVGQNVRNMQHYRYNCGVNRLLRAGDR